MMTREFPKLASDLASFSIASRAIIQRHFRTDMTVDGKSDLSPVTIADKQSEAVLREAITASYPTHHILGEEEGGTISGGYDWVIDPIDGTRAFICGKPQFGTLIALCDNLVPIAGMIDMPILNECYIATTDTGSMMNDVPIQVSSVTDLSRARIASTAPEAFSQKALPYYSEFSQKCLTSGWGGDCYNYALLAAGHLEIVIEHQLANHDIMALVPVIEQAGGIVTDWQGAPIRLGHSSSIIAAATPSLHELALDAMAGAV